MKKPPNVSRVLCCNQFNGANKLKFQVYFEPSDFIGCFLIDLSLYFPKKSEKRLYFTTRPYENHLNYFVPTNLIDSGAKEYGCVTIIKDGNDDFIKNSFVGFLVTIHEYKQNNLLTEFDSFTGFDCYGSLLGFDCYGLHNKYTLKNVSCFSNQEIENDNNFYAVGFYKSGPDCEGIDIILNKKVKILPYESLVIKVNYLLRDNVLRDNVDLFFLRSKFSRQMITLDCVKYTSCSVSFYINSLNKFTVFLGERFIQILLDDSIISNFRNYFCLKHLEIGDSPRKPKLNMSNKPLPITKGSKYTSENIDDILERCEYIRRKTLWPTTEQIEKHAHKFTRNVDANNYNLHEIEGPFKNENWQKFKFPLFPPFSSKQEDKNFKMSMFKLNGMMINFLLSILPDFGEEILELLDVDDIKDVYLKNVFKKDEQILALHLTFLEGHCAEGKSKIIKNLMVDNKLLEFDNLLRADNCLILKNYTNIIPWIYICATFSKLVRISLIPHDDQCVQLFVDRYILSHALFGEFEEIKKLIDYKQSSSFKDTDIKEIEIIESCNIKNFVEFYNVLIASFSHATLVSVNLHQPDLEIDSFYEYRAYEKELYESVENFNTFGNQFRALLLRFFHEAAKKDDNIWRFKEWKRIISFQINREENNSFTNQEQIMRSSANMVEKFFKLDTRIFYCQLWAFVSAYNETEKIFKFKFQEKNICHEMNVLMLDGFIANGKSMKCREMIENDPTIDLWLDEPLNFRNYLHNQKSLPILYIVYLFSELSKLDKQPSLKVISARSPLSFVTFQKFFNSSTNEEMDLFPKLVTRLFACFAKEITLKISIVPDNSKLLDKWHEDRVFEKSKWGETNGDVSKKFVEDANDFYKILFGLKDSF